jgi:hypothetical protein
MFSLIDLYLLPLSWINLKNIFIHNEFEFEIGMGLIVRLNHL